jgi:hypothetical protein
MSLSFSLFTLSVCGAFARTKATEEDVKVVVSHTRTFDKSAVPKLLSYL